MSDTALTPDEIASEAERIGKGAGQILLKYFDKLQPGQVEVKSSHRDLLSVADSECEDYVIESIRSKFPSHSILGEENGFIDAGSDYCWVIDPLDGTTNFVHSIPMFATSIGVLFKGEPLVGIVEAPYLGESFMAAKGSGCHLNGVRCEVSQTTELSHTILATGFSYNRNNVSRNNIDNFSKLILSTHDLRRGGAASLDLAYVAAGRYDGFWEPYLSPWDVAAGVLLVTEAGGCVSDYAGSELASNYVWQENIIATNGKIHAQVKGELSGVEEGYKSKYADYSKHWT